MNPNRDSQTVHIVGGGLAGLTAAATVARAGCSVVVHEQRGRLGGRATTDERNGYRFNQGPHALYLGGDGLGVLTDLGVRLPGLTPRAGGRMVYEGESFRAPASPAGLATTRLLGARDKLDLGKVLSRLGSLDPSTLATTSVGDWVDSVTDRAKARAVLYAYLRLASYVHAPAALSAEVAVMQLQQVLTTGVRYLAGGWETMVAQLAELVVGAGGRIETGDVFTELPDAPAVIVAAGGPEAAIALTGITFDTGPRSEASVLDLALSSAAKETFAVGVDQPFYLSDHGSPGEMTPAGAASLSLAQYLLPGDGPGTEPDRAALRAFAAHAGVTDDLVVAERYLHRMTTVSAIPTSGLGGLRGRPAVAVGQRPGVFLAGDWVGPRGHLADAVLSSAREAARCAVAHVQRRVAV